MTHEEVFTLASGILKKEEDRHEAQRASRGMPESVRRLLPHLSCAVVCRPAGDYELAIRLGGGFTETPGEAVFRVESTDSEQAVRDLVDAGILLLITDALGAICQKPG